MKKPITDIKMLFCCRCRSQMFQRLNGFLLMTICVENPTLGDALVLERAWKAHSTTGTGLSSESGTFQANTGLIRARENTRGRPRGPAFLGRFTGLRRYLPGKRPRRQTVINASDSLVGLFSAKHLKGPNF